jgi:hypothetical protein
MQTDFLSPLLLATDAFALNANGVSVIPNTVQLINPNRTPMLIDQFRVTSGYPPGWAMVQMKLTYGSTPLTNSFIPLSAFMPAYHDFSADSTRVWHLAKPLYVPPDVQVGVEFKVVNTLGTTLSSNAMYNFGIAGRSLPAGMPVPKKIYVPWACATTVYDTTNPYVSSDADLGNPFDSVLNLDYLCGFAAQTSEESIQRYFTVQMTLSNGKVLARDPIPFYALFPPNRNILRMRAPLQPKEFISVVLDMPVPGGNNMRFTTLGMTGWRELDTPKGAQP